jgi:signal peptide peptidase SppA
MKFEQLSRALSEPALITPEAHRGLQKLFAGFVSGGGVMKTPSAEELSEWKRLAKAEENPRRVSTEDDDEENDTSDGDYIPGPVRFIPVRGVLMRNPGIMQELCMGACSLARIQRQVTECANDPTCQVIVLNFDTPGGSVAGTLEAARAIQRASTVKPVVSVIQGQCCSGGYFLASQSTLIISEPTGLTGSIGVYIAYLDDSSALSKAGFAWEVFRAGEHKAAGLGRALTKVERAQIQTLVDQAYVQFTDAVTQGRGPIDPAVMQGQVFTAADALENGLIDAIEDDVPGFLSGLVSDPNYLAKVFSGE